MSRLTVLTCCAALAAAPALAQVPAGKPDAAEQAALARKQKEEAEKKAFIARVAQCEKQINSQGLKGNSAKNYMRNCMK